MPPTVSRNELIEFAYELPDVVTDANGFNLVYDPGATMETSQLAIRRETDTGITGAME